jgi:hypothetical protein
MADFSGRIVSAQYANTERTIIKVLYEEDEKLFPYSFPNDENNPDYQALMEEGWDHDKILDDTVERLKAESRAHNIEINKAAKELAREMLGMQVLQDQKDELEKKVSDQESTLLNLDKQVKIKKNEVDTEFFRMLFDDNANKEELFKFKLWALELDFVKEADKDIKSKIRKAERITEGMGFIDSLLK